MSLLCLLYFSISKFQLGFSLCLLFLLWDILFFNICLKNVSDCSLYICTVSTLSYLREFPHPCHFCIGICWLFSCVNWNSSGFHMLKSLLNCIPSLTVGCWIVFKNYEDRYISFTGQPTWVESSSKFQPVSVGSSSEPYRLLICPRCASHQAACGLGVHGPCSRLYLVLIRDKPMYVWVGLSPGVKRSPGDSMFPSSSPRTISWCSLHPFDPQADTWASS